jgi:hypothetical protein
MDWRLVFGLSLFGAAMGVSTVYLVPSNVEPAFWLVIFALCAWVIARRGVPRPFLHGLAVSVVNSVWITAAHVLLFDAYLARHAREAEMVSRMPLPPRVMMALTGPVVGVASGLILGTFAVVAARLVGRPRRAPG